MSKAVVSEETLNQLCAELHAEPLHVKIHPLQDGGKRVVFHRRICNEGTPQQASFEFTAVGALAKLSNDELVQAVGQAFMCAGFEKVRDDDGGH